MEIKLKPLEIGKEYMTKFQVPEPVEIYSVLSYRTEKRGDEVIMFPKNVYVTYLNTPELGRCLLDADRIVHERDTVTEEKDIRLYYFKDGIMRKIGAGTTLYKIKHHHKSVAECKDAIHKHNLSKYDLKNRFVQFLIVEYTGALQAKIVEIINKDYIKDFINDGTTIQTS